MKKIILLAVVILRGAKVSGMYTASMRDSGNDFDRFLFSFLEVGFRTSKLSSNYPTRNSNFKSCFLDTRLKLFSFLVYHFLSRS